MSGNDQGGGDAEFEAFEAAGTVEVGDSNLDAGKTGEGDKSEKTGEADEAKPAKRRGPPKEAAKAAAPAKGAEEGEEGDEKPPKKAAKTSEEEAGDEEEKPAKTGEEEDEDEEEEKPKKSERKPSDRIRELTKRLRTSENLRAGMEDRLSALEKGGLPKTPGADRSDSQELPAPDPTDTEKYPLGHLDDRYIEDKLEWLTDKKAAERADAVLLRQQEAETIRAQERQQQDLLGKVDDLAERGSDIEDFQESVIEAGMRGDWDLSQATFEAAHEVDNGAQILHELSQDKKEASRVAKLSNFQQMKFVQERDAEIEKAKGGRKIPKAGAPPENQARGANSKTQINPATDNLDDFEKAWERDAKGKS